LPGTAPTVASRVARVLRDAHVDVATVLILGAFVVLRLWATIGSTITAYPDSPSYFHFELWGGVRFPVVTALYASIGDHRTLVTLQAIVGALCWSLAAVIAGALVVPRPIRYGFQVAVLLLGVTLPMTRFDNALLSESISISVAVLLAALALRLVCRPSTPLAIVVFAVAAVWALIRQNNAQLVLVAAVAVAVLGLRGAHRRLAAGLAAGFVLLALLGALLATSNHQIEQFNTAQILGRRIVNNPARDAWFRAHGMPNAARALDRQRALSPDGNIDSTIALLTDPVFAAWVADDGARTYFRYLATHPGFVITTPFDDDEAYRSALYGVTAYGSSRRVVPRLVDSIFWPQSERGQAVFQVLVAFGLVAVIVRAARDPRARRPALAGFAVLAVALANVAIITTLAGGEYARLMLTAAAVGRVAILWLFATGVGHVEIRDRGDGRAVGVPA
jgi:hypothetical protein